MMFQIHALFSPRSAHQLMWNRFAKLKYGQGGYISLDLNLEFYNRTVKQAIKKLGSTVSKRSFNRICHSVDVTKALMNAFDSEVRTYKTSGNHVSKSTLKDLKNNCGRSYGSECPDNNAWTELQNFILISSQAC